MDLKTLCKKQKLIATDAFWNTPEDVLRKIYNGAGSDSMPAWSRAILTEFLRIFKGAIVIHDFDFDRSDRTEEKFHEANKRMYDNMKIILDTTYPLYSILEWGERAKWWFKMKAVYEAIELCGLSAWKD